MNAERNLDTIRSKRVLTIRRHFGNECAACPICGRPPAEPYRNVVGGVVTEGCVDATHMNGGADDWHNRPEAIAIRKDTYEQVVGDLLESV